MLLECGQGEKPPGEQRIDLTPAEPVRGRLLDPDGKPLTGVQVRGLNRDRGRVVEPLPGTEFVASPPHPDRPRRLAFRHDGRKLVGTAVVAAGLAKPIEVRLEPWGSVFGRLVDTEGRPVAKASIFSPCRHNARDRRW